MVPSRAVAGDVAQTGLVRVGEPFGRYVVEAAIGRGGMGEVYRAFDPRLERHVALKLVREDRQDQEAVARLAREARAAASLTHPNTVAIHDLGEVDGVFFMVMELVQGSPLVSFVGDSRISLARKLAWLGDIARALAAAHAAGITHRDVKPANVMISDRDVVKVLDFGLAKPIDAVSLRSQAGLVLGTPRYMAPEILEGAHASPASDQYAFGLLAYELISGTLPPPAGAAETEAVRLDRITSAARVNADLARVIERTLSRAPSERFLSMDDVVVALSDVAHGRRLRFSLVEETVRDGPTTSAVDTLREETTASAPPGPVRTEPHPARTETRPMPAPRTLRIDPRRNVRELGPDGSRTLPSPAEVPRFTGPAATLLSAATPPPVRPVEAAAVRSPPASAPEPPRPVKNGRFVWLILAIGLVVFALTYFVTRELAHGGSLRRPPGSPAGTESPR